MGVLVELTRRSIGVTKDRRCKAEEECAGEGRMVGGAFLVDLGAGLHEGIDVG
jgi:hypothetical protein